MGSAHRRLMGIDGLRAVAAAAIVACHTWGATMNGHPTGYWLTLFFNNLALGVTLFFTLSGFLLYRPVAAAVLRHTAQPSGRDYAINRALRIAPAYWVILLLCGLVLGTTYVGWEREALVTGHLTDPGLLIRAALLAQDYRPESMIVGIGPAWSLAVEAVFYLVLPLLGLLAARLAGAGAPGRRRTLAALAPSAALLALGLAGKLAAWKLVPGAPADGWSPTWHAVVERSFCGQADLFAFGMALAVVWVQVADGRLRLPARWRVAAVVGALVVLAPCLRTLADAQLSYLPQNTFVALAFALLLAAVVVRAPGEAAPAVARGLELRPLVAVGLASYSLFLWHEPVLLWLARHGWLQDGRAGLVVNLLLVGVVAGVLSLVTYRLVERPALSRKVRAHASAVAGRVQPAGADA